VVDVDDQAEPVAFWGQQLDDDILAVTERVPDRRGPTDPGLAELGEPSRQRVVPGDEGRSTVKKVKKSSSNCEQKRKSINWDK
jgi:hypothetical protein